MYYVYALCDPFTMEEKYIGCTENPWARLKFHCGKHRTTSKHLAQWLDDMVGRGVAPAMKILRSFDDRDAAIESENQEIAARGESVFNVANGVQSARQKQGPILPPIDGKRGTVAAWAARIGISHQALCQRLQRHPVDVALQIELPPVAVKANPLAPPSGRAYTPMLNREQRRDRRRLMREAVQSGEAIVVVAVRFGVTEATVRTAVNEVFANAEAAQ